MTDLLCTWLNDELHISKRITPATFAREFASGYMLGEILHRYQLQDDFDQFSHNTTADSKLNNFTRIEPMLHLLGIPFDHTIARDIMTEKHGTATRLLYQMYIALNNKKKANLSQVAMKTLKTGAQTKLGITESEMFKEHLKRATPRQTDLNLQALINRFHEHQTRMEQMTFKEKFEESERLKQQRQNERQCLIDKSRKMREKQTELLAKINAATVHIPQPPANQTLQALQAQKELRRKREADETVSAIHQFEEKFKVIAPASDEGTIFDIQYVTKKAEIIREPINKLNLASNNEYIGKIRKRLQEDAVAREEREKRRRKVLSNQMNAHLVQEEARREEMMVNRLLRLSQHERRIAVQLMHVRHEKEVIRQHRIFRETQYRERREKDFSDALDREVEIASQRKAEYAEEVKAQQELHDLIAAQRAENRYYRHYNMCAEIVGSILDFASKVAEYRELTNNLVPAKLMREWKLLFEHGQPLFEPLEVEVKELSPEQILEDERQQLLDEGDFLEYRSMTGDWLPPENCEIKEPPYENPVISHIVQRLFNIAHPPTPLPAPPEFPAFPIRACVLGKVFSGKTTCIRRLAMEHNLEILVPEVLLQKAVEAHKAGEVETAEKEVQAIVSEELEEIPSEQSMSTPELDNMVGSRKDTANIANVTTTITPAVTSNPEGVTPNPAILTSIPEGVTPNSAVRTTNPEAVTPNVTVDKAISEEGVEPLVSADGVRKETMAHPKISGFETKSHHAGPEPTLRAKLGSKALKFLKKGLPVDDQVMVDILVEAIRKIPENKGWILEGFPQTYKQAKILEKALSGCDGSTIEKKASKNVQKSSLIPYPPPASQSHIPHSGIDVVILFDIRDELCLKRAYGRLEQLQAEKTFHEELDPPPEGSATGVGNVEKVHPVHDPYYDEQHIQTRITSFLDHWPKLQKWFLKFGTLKVVDASLEKESVFLETEKILEDMLDMIESKDKQEKVILPEEKQEEKEEAPGGPPQTSLPPELPVETPAPGGPDDRASRPISKASSRTQTDEANKTDVGKISKDSKHSKTSGAEEEMVMPSSEVSAEKVLVHEKPELEATPRHDADVEFEVVISVTLGSPKSGGSPKDKKSKSPKGKSSEVESPRRKGSRAPRKKSQGGTAPEPEPEPESAPPLPKPGDKDWIFVDLDIDNELAIVLMNHWEEMEKAYITNLKTVFRNIREEREHTFRFFSQIRKDFILCLRKPDCKQEYINQWQKTYNEVPDDMRDDEEMRAELHQQVDDLVERLWNICDERKAQAEAERLAVMKNGWLEDRLGILTNHYFTIMQAEVDRLQDTVRLLKDYYQRMDGLVPDALNPNYERLPLIQLSFERPGVPEDEASEITIAGDDKVVDTKPLSGRRSSKSPRLSPKDGKTSQDKKRMNIKENEVTDDQNSEIRCQKTVIPLLPHYTFIAETDSKHGKPSGRESSLRSLIRRGKEETPHADGSLHLHDQDERHIYEGYLLAVNIITQINQAEMLIKEAEEEAERLKELEKEKASKGKVTKGPKKSPSLKKVNKTKEPEMSATVLSNTSEHSQEELAKKIIKARAKEELYFCIHEEAQMAIHRLELVYMVASAVLQDLKSKGEDAFKAMDDWLGAKFLKEMESISQMALVMRDAIEHGEKIKHEIILEMDSFIVDEDLKVLRTPSPEPPPSPVEEPMANQFTVDQLKSLYEQLKVIAPSGIITKKAFTEMFESLVSVTHGMESLPDQWMQLTSSQIQELSNALSSESEYVDWRRLLVALCYPIPTPTQKDLLECLQRFKRMDQRATGTVTREQWQWITLWYTSELCTKDVYDRMSSLKRLLFEMFADHAGPFAVLDYVNFLMYFSAAANYHEGFLRALSVATGHHMPRLDKPFLQATAHVSRSQTSAIDASERKDEKKISPEPPMSDEIIPPESQDAEVSLEALFKVLHHSDIHGGDSHRFSVAADAEDHRSIERLTNVFQELNEDDSTSPIMYRVLIEHPLIQDVVIACKHFKAVELRSILSQPLADIIEISNLPVYD